MSKVDVIREDIRELSVSEQVALLDDIWEQIAMRPEELPITDSQKAELDRRLEEADENPSAGIPWEVVREDLRSRE